MVFLSFWRTITSSVVMSCRYVYPTPPLIILALHKKQKVCYQNLIRHLLNLMALALNLILEFSLTPLYDLQPFHLVLQGLPPVLQTSTKMEKMRH